MKFTVKKLREDAILPTRGSKKASGLDLYAVEDTLINVGERKVVKTGIAFGIPEGYEIQVRPRSGLSLKTGLIIPNSPGTIDQDFVGECGVILYLASGDETAGYLVKRGDRIAQAALCPVSLENPTVVEELQQTERGDGAYGSTGL